MKKLMALLLSLCLLVGCVSAFAEQGYKAHVTASIPGEDDIDVTAQLVFDEDGCPQLLIDGSAGEQLLNAFIQIGKEALVLGSDGEFAQIDYETLLAAAQNVLDEKLTDEQKMVIAVVVYLFTGLEGDLQVISDLVENEVTRILNLGMAQGVITYGRGGTITFEADLEQLKTLASAYLTALAQDDETFEKLTQTQIWSLAQLGDAETAKTQIAQIASALESAELPEGLDVHVKAVITMDGSIDLNVEAKYPEQLDMSLAASYASNALSIELNGDINGIEIEYSYNVSVDENGAVNGSVYEKMTDITGAETVAEGTFSYVNGVLTENAALNATMSSSITVVGNGNLTVDFNECSANMDMTVTATNEGEGMGNFKLNCSFDTVNGLDFAFESDINGELNALYVKANAQQTEYGMVIAANADVVYEGIELNDLFNLEIVISDTLSVKCHLNSYRDYLGNTEYSSFVVQRVNDLLSGVTYDYYNYEEWEKVKDTLEDSEYNVFDFAMTFDPNTMALSATLTADNDNVTVIGTMGEDNYTLTATYNDTTLATAVLDLSDGYGFAYAAILGKLTVTLYDGTVIERIASVEDNKIAWIFTATNGDVTQEIEVGIINLTEGDRNHIEAYVSYQGMTVTLGIVYEQSESSIYAEAYVNLNGEKYADVTAELSITDEAGTHVEGTPIPQNYLESMLSSIYDMVMDGAEKVKELF